ncbi:TPA: hypothetical protein ACH3X1_003401 [Trebouxia sp. C0004]
MPLSNSEARHSGTVHGCPRRNVCHVLKPDVRYTKSFYRAVPTPACNPASASRRLHTFAAKQSAAGTHLIPAAIKNLQADLLAADPTSVGAENVCSEQVTLGQPLICISTTLTPETNFAAGVESLKAAAKELAIRYQHYSSGVVRLEVPLPRGLTALQWLQGQPKPQSDKQSLLQPQVYFSPRQSSAPGTAGAAAAEAATAGVGAVAGAGAAWLWHGRSGQPLSSETVQEMSSFLSPDHPRLRVLGGTRFNTSQPPHPEWADFGSYCFMLPRLEMLEVSGCTVLSCNVAWHAQAAHTNSQHGSWQAHIAKSQDNCDSSRGFSSVQDAVAHAVAALDGVKAPAVPAAPALQVNRHSVVHIPDQEGWSHLMQPLHDALATSAIRTDRLPQLNHVHTLVS